MPRYAVGDSIVLKDGFVRTETAGRTCKITAVLPSEGSRPQYRVRFEAENFDRRILESDIDLNQSAPPSPAIAKVMDIQGGSWLKTSSIRVRK
ncbi:cold-shock protein [Rhizobium sp. YTU87027]|uniref:cold-shock protein n=1 Tax=Rhizobium sp. YTU87027 TaxID=3417741 RepID=UPI003D68BFEC